jgi:tetratricopeptide (TPR) repeat protein
MPKPCLRALLPAMAMAIVLGGCASTAALRADVPTALFDDALFGPPTEPIDRARIFAVNEEMRRYAQAEVTPLIRKLGAQRALTETLYGAGRLKLEYDSEVTRTAAEAFDARAGNCLSLVIMTAAFARELGLAVRYQSAYLEETWSRRGSLLLKSGHVNITLGERIGESGLRMAPTLLTVDFFPPDELRELKTVEISESVIVAMFMNNRAVEALAQDRLDDAYAWAREAVRADASFIAAQNTLGVVYLRRGALAQAGAAFEHVLKADPSEPSALANFAQVASRAAEAHFRLGVAYYQRGDVERAKHELSQAADSSATRRERDLYSAKLDWLRAQRAR